MMPRVFKYQVHVDIIDKFRLIDDYMVSHMWLLVVLLNIYRGQPQPSTHQAVLRFSTQVEFVPRLDPPHEKSWSREQNTTVGTSFTKNNRMACTHQLYMQILEQQNQGNLVSKGPTQGQMSMESFRPSTGGQSIRNPKREGCSQQSNYNWRYVGVKG